MSSQVERYGQTYCAVLCDIDCFKPYNDTYGHLAGDEVLRRVAGTIASHCRIGDVAYRYGGEEFLILLPEQSLETGIELANRLRRAVEELKIRHEAKDPPGVVTISAGVAALTEYHETADELLVEADTALYTVKEGGRNVVKPELKPG